MLSKLFFAAAGVALLASSPAFAGPWVNYDGYYPIGLYAQYAVPYYYAYGSYVYPYSRYAYPYGSYTDVTVGVPVVTYAPVHVRVYTVPQEPPYYNVPPYAVYAPY